MAKGCCPGGDKQSYRTAHHKDPLEELNRLGLFAFLIITSASHYINSQI